MSVIHAAQSGGETRKQANVVFNRPYKTKATYISDGEVKYYNSESPYPDEYTFSPVDVPSIFMISTSSPPSGGDLSVQTTGEVTRISTVGFFFLVKGDGKIKFTW